MKKRLTLIALSLMLLSVVAGGYFYKRIVGYADTSLLIPNEVIFTLPAGSGRVALEKLLIQQKIISHSGWFAWLLKVKPELAKFKAGTYRFPAGMTIGEMLLLLRSGKEAQFSIRFIEGSRLEEWFTILQQAPYLQHKLTSQDIHNIAVPLQLKESGNEKNMEGWFYPDTYLYTANTTDISILLRAHQSMSKMVEKIWQERDKDLPYTTLYEMLIMASLIEKETAINDERAMVASVFINRLRYGMRLQTDPTVIYGMGDQYKGNITRKDLETSTPYNTYTINGLPPTPIAMPGKASLEAAAHPANTSYLYFVADGKGGHTFTSNLNSHNQAVRDYLKTLKKDKENGG